VDPREDLEWRRVHRRHLGEPLALGGEVERLLKDRYDEIDPVLAHRALDVVDELLRLLGGRGGD
jgi:hypothetical protein